MALKYFQWLVIVFVVGGLFSAFRLGLDRGFEHTIGAEAYGRIGFATCAAITELAHHGPRGYIRNQAAYLAALAVAVFAHLALLSSAIFDFTPYTFGSVTNPRFLSAIATIPGLHIAFSMMSDSRTDWHRAVLLAFQASMVVFAISIRSVAIWVPFGLAILGTALWLSRRSPRSLWPLGMLLGIWVVHAIYISQVLNPIYARMGATGSHTVWHSIYYSLQIHPDWNTKYGESHRHATGDNQPWAACAPGLSRLGSDMTAVVSQGCRPVGDPFVITKAEGNIVYELAGKPALERLQDVARGLDDDERQLLARGVHLGRVIDESQTTFGPGDFLVRSVLGGDPSNGAIAVGDLVDVGSTAQFQVRDAASADEELHRMLDGRVADGALVFTCNGRGTRLFGRPDHDAEIVSEHVPARAVAGMFCAGELGPVGRKNFLHGFTASVVLFGGSRA